MKKFSTKIVFAIVIATAALTSCMKTEEIVPTVTSSDAISFGTFVDQTTKGTIYHTSDMQESGFGLMGFYNRQNVWEDAAPEMIMYNQLVEYSEAINAWTYSPVKYWSNISGDYYSFFAYAPYSTSTAANGNIALSSNTSTGVPVVSFTVDTNPLKMVDFVAGQESDITQTEDVVRFDLKHQLTRVSFSAKTDITTDESKNTDATYVVIKDMDLVVANNFYLSGDYTFDLDNSTVLHDDHEQDGVWSNLKNATEAYDFSSLLAVTDTAIGNYTVSGSTVSDLVITEVDGYTESGVRVANTNASETSLFTSGQYLFLLPPNGQDGLETAGDVAITVSYDIVTVDKALDAGYSVYATKTATVLLPAASLKQGRAYDILLTFDLTEIKVAGNVILWDESEIDDYEATTGLDENGEDEEEVVVPDDYVPALTVSSSTKIMLTTGSAIFASELTGTDPDLDYSIAYSVEGATITSEGLFTATAGGVYTITATASADGADDVVATTTITVYYTIAESFTMAIDPSEELSLTEGGANGKKAISYVYVDGIDTNYIESYTTSWSSSDETVATVVDGEVTPVAAGTTSISATATGLLSNTTVTSDSCAANVSEAMSISISYDGFTGYVGLVVTTPATIELELVSSNLPENATITWTSNNTDYATVDENGAITLLASTGDETVTITASYGDVSSSLEIKVGTITVSGGSSGSGSISGN